MRASDESLLRSYRVRTGVPRYTGIILGMLLSKYSRTSARTQGRHHATISHYQNGIGKSRIIQTFRDQSVHERLLRDPESEPFLLRRHHVTAQTGFAGRRRVGG